MADMDVVSLAEWARAAEKAGLDLDFYAHRKWGSKQELPWAPQLSP
jgi:hypothetical protein